MSEEDDDQFEENPGVGSLEPEETQPEKNHLLQELFGEESEDSTETPAPQSNLKRAAPPPEPTATKNKGPERVLKRQKKGIESPIEEDGQDDNDDEGSRSPLPNFTSSLDNQDDVVIDEEQEIRLDEMPFEKPPDDCPLHYFKLSGLGIEPKPFDEETYKEEIEEGEKKKKKAGPTVRWRFSLDDTKNQALIRESNARFVRWSDGSMHLVVGKDYYGVQSQEFKDYHHLFIRQRKDINTEAFLQCHGILERKLVLVLTDNTSIKKETLQKLKNLKSLESSGARRQFAISTNDPEKEKKQKEQLEDSKSDLRKQYGRDQMNQELTRDFLEDEEDDEEREKDIEAKIMAAKFTNHKDVKNTSTRNRRESIEEHPDDDDVDIDT